MTVPVVKIDTSEHYVWCDGCDDRLLMESEQPSAIQQRMPPQKTLKSGLTLRVRTRSLVLSRAMTMELDGEIFAIHPQRDIHVIASAQNRTINRPRSDLVFTIIPMTPRHDDRVLV